MPSSATMEPTIDPLQGCPENPPRCAEGRVTFCIDIGDLVGEKLMFAIYMTFCYYKLTQLQTHFCYKVELCVRIEIVDDLLGIGK